MYLDKVKRKAVGGEFQEDLLSLVAGTNPLTWQSRDLSYKRHGIRTLLHSQLMSGKNTVSMQTTMG